MMQLIDVARMLRSMFMSVSRWIAEAAVWACSVVRTRWPGHRRAKRDLGRFLVADLADEEHVRVRAQHRPQARSRT